MNNNMQRLIATIIPFIMLGISVALMIGFFVVFSYVLLWGLLIGMILWVAACVKEYFFPKETESDSQGRIIEYKKSRKIK